MGKGIKAIIILGLLGVLGFGLLGDFIPQLAETATTVSDNTSNPAILRTVFDWWWLLPAGAVIGIVLKSFNGLGGRSRRSRRR